MLEFKFAFCCMKILNAFKNEKQPARLPKPRWYQAESPASTASISLVRWEMLI